MIRANIMRHRLKLETLSTASQDTFGEDDAGYTLLGTRDAAIEPLKGNERFVAQQLDPNLSHKITMRWDSTVATLTPKGRLVMMSSTSRVFDVQSIINVDERDHTLEIMAMERV